MKRPKCCRCGDVATICAHDYGSGPGVWFCGPCRQQHRSGADSWAWTGVAWGDGPKNGRKPKEAQS